MKQSGFFDVEERLARLSGLGDQLEAFSRTVDFEVFRPDLDKALAYSDGSKGGRPPFDPVLMSKILVIQTLNNLSDQRSPILHAFPCSGAVGSCAYLSGCETSLG
ncbi:Mobile element protein [Acetobacter malorum]|nr:Mobile element protein [Acetobacter malorum]